MNIKVGDRVRIKTKDELLQSGYCFVRQAYYDNHGNLVYKKELGKIVKILECDKDYYWYQNIQSGKIDSIPQNAIAEIIPPTLDEYICGLPLKERAKYFVYRSEFDWYSTLFGKDAHFVFEEEAIQATIEALKQPKE